MKIELFLPKFTDVLSTDTPTQLIHGILHPCNTLFILSKIAEAVADCFPEYNNKNDTKKQPNKQTKK